MLIATLLEYIDIYSVWIVPFESILRLNSYIYIYIYSHPQTDCFVVSQLFSVARHVCRLKLGSKPGKLYVRLSIIPLSQQVNHVSS